jgi:hypothetical protein
MPSIPLRPLYLLVPQQDQQQPQGSYNCNHEDYSLDSKHHEGGSDNDSEVSDTTTRTNPSSPTSSYNNCCNSKSKQEPKQQQQLFLTTSETAQGCQQSGEEGEPSTLQTLSASTTSKDSQDIHSENDVKSENDLPMVDITSSRTSATIDGAAPAPAPADTKAEGEKETKKKRSIGFEPLSTLYVFDDNASGKEDKDYYDIDNTWYSSRELKSFRADAFLTVNWMVMKGIIPITTKAAQSSSENNINNRTNENYCYYSNKYGYDRQREIQTIARKGQFEFCERGIECRTPLGRVLKNKRRLDAMRVVMLYQQMQKQHRRERRREQRRQKQNQYSEGDNVSNHSKKSKNNTIRRHTPDPEAVRKIEADIDADALANVYGSYCKESTSEAFIMGRADASAAGIPSSSTTTITTTTASSGQEATLLAHPYDRTTTDKGPTITTSSRNYQNNNTVKFECPSLCDEDDDELLMDKLVSLSFVHHDEDDESDNDDDEECSTTSSSPPNDDISWTSDTSLSLKDLAESNINDERLNSNSNQQQHPVVEVEVELIEGNDDQPHRIIYCSDDSGYVGTSVSQQRQQQQQHHFRQKSWSHPEWKLPLSCTSQLESSSLAASAHTAPPMSSSFASLELGGLIFGTLTGLYWCSDGKGVNTQR